MPGKIIEGGSLMPEDRTPKHDFCVHDSGADGGVRAGVFELPCNGSGRFDISYAGGRTT